jgi:hypothetical protein
MKEVHSMASDEKVGLLLKLISLLAQIAIPVAIFYAGRHIARAQYTKSMQDAWNDFNKLIIANDDNLRAARKLPGFALSERSDDDIRKVYLAFVALNTFQGAYLGAKHGLLDKEYQVETFENLLEPLMADDDVFALTKRGYHPKFKKACKKIKDSLARSQGNSVTETPNSGVRTDG